MRESKIVSTLNLPPLGEGSGLGDGLGEGLGSGLRSFRRGCWSSSLLFNGRSNCFSLGGTRHVSEILREIVSSESASLLLADRLVLRSLGRLDSVSPSLASVSWDVQQVAISSIRRWYSAAFWSWSHEDDEVEGSVMGSKSSWVMVGQCLRAAARAINPASAILFLRKSTRFNSVPVAKDSHSEMIPEHVSPFSWSPKFKSERLRSSPHGISPMIPSSPSSLWPKLSVWRVWLVACFKMSRVVIKSR